MINGDKFKFDYDDTELFGTRRHVEPPNVNCIIYTNNTVIDPHPWSVKKLVKENKRLKLMLDSMEINSPFSIQRVCWPQMSKNGFPFVCIAPQASGKTSTYLLYILSKHVTSSRDRQLEGDLGLGESLSSFTLTETKPKKRITQQVNYDEIDQDNFDFNSLDCGEPESAAKENEQINGFLGTNTGCEEIVTHPSYLVICSNQNTVENVSEAIERLKSSAYSERVTDGQVRDLKPIARTISMHQTDDKLAIRCIGCEVLITTPTTLSRCLDMGFINFNKCKKVFFDDIDLALQLHNNVIRDLMKNYLVQVEQRETPQTVVATKTTITDDSTHIYFFAKKWTNLVRQFISAIFSQITLIFGSMLEASIYANLKYELEICNNQDEALKKLAGIVSCSSTQTDNLGIGIICHTDREAQQVSNSLIKLGVKVRYLPEQNANFTLISRSNNRLSKCPYVTCDSAIEFIMGDLNTIKLLIHFSLPDSMDKFDQRFKLMHTCITDRLKNISTIIFMGFNKGMQPRDMKELHDLTSRSTNTPNSTKFMLRDMISKMSTVICWRWASLGSCRLERVIQRDCLGSFCSFRHSVSSTAENGISSDKILSGISVPQEGQCRITLTNLVSPSEFYFWLDAYKPIERTGEWVEFQNCGSNFMRQFQTKLDKLKNTESCSVALDKFQEGRVYGIYMPHEARVDRVAIVSLPKLNKLEGQGAYNLDGTSKVLKSLSNLVYSPEYSKLCEVYKVDYGIRISAYLRNIFELPSELGPHRVEAQCKRGFHLAYKPTDNETDWIYKAKKQFRDLAMGETGSVQSTTAWLRYTSDNCFWFENMQVHRELAEPQGLESSNGSATVNRLTSQDPHAELVRSGLAEWCHREPPCLPPSRRLATLSRWQHERTASLGRKAFLRRDRFFVDLLLMRVDHADLTLTVRQSDFNKQLCRLEDKLETDYKEGKLKPLGYLAEDVFCLAKLDDDPQSNYFCLNRCKIVELIRTGRQSTATIDTDTTNKQNSIKHSDQEEQLDALETGTLSYSQSGVNKCRLECLDHGDEVTLEPGQLRQMEPEHLTEMPFQAIKARLAYLEPALIGNQSQTQIVAELISKLTRNSNNKMIPVRASFQPSSKAANSNSNNNNDDNRQQETAEDHLYLYLPQQDGGFVALEKVLEEKHQISLCLKQSHSLPQHVQFGDEKAALDDPQGQPDQDGSVAGKDVDKDEDEPSMLKPGLQSSMNRSLAIDDYIISMLNKLIHEELTLAIAKN